MRQTLCGWLLPGPLIIVPPGAPRLFAICAAVLPLPYRFDASGFDEVFDEQVALVPVPPPVVQLVLWSVVLLGLTPGALCDWAVFCAGAVFCAAGWLPELCAWPGGVPCGLPPCESCAGVWPAELCAAWPGGVPCGLPPCATPVRPSARGSAKSAARRAR